MDTVHCGITSQTIYLLHNLWICKVISVTSLAPIYYLDMVDVQAEKHYCMVAWFPYFFYGQTNQSESVLP